MHILKEWSRKFNSSPHCHCRYQHDRQISGLSPQTFLATPRSTPTPASIHGRITSSRGKDQHQKEQEFSASSTQYSSVDYSLYGWPAVLVGAGLRNQRNKMTAKKSACCGSTQLHTHHPAPPAHAHLDGVINNSSAG